MMNARVSGTRCWTRIAARACGWSRLRSTRSVSPSRRRSVSPTRRCRKDDQAATVGTVDEFLPALPEDWERALAVVAHPDDLEYGAASAVARWTAQGKAVTYVLVTDGEAGIDGLAPDECGPLRREEEVRSAAFHALAAHGCAARIRRRWQ